MREEKTEEIKQLDNTFDKNRFSKEDFRNNLDYIFRETYKRFILLVLFVFLGIVGIFALTRIGQFSSPDVEVSQVETAIPSVSPTYVPASTLDRIETNDRVIFLTNKGLFEINLKTEDIRKLAEEKDIIDISSSPDGRKIAILVRGEGQRPLFGYPTTGLSIIDLVTNNILEIIPVDEQVVRYPRWSPDGKYLSLWLDDGRSSQVYDYDSQKIILHITTEETESPASPIVFVSAQDERIAYIKNGWLFETDTDGQNQMQLISGLSSFRSVHEGPPLPNPPYYSPDGRFVAVYRKNGDLLLYDKHKNIEKVISSGYEGQMFGDSPSGFIIGFTDSKFLYYVIGEKGHSYSEEPPVFAYDLEDGSIYDFSIDHKSVDLSSIIMSPDLKSIISHSVYTRQGTILYSDEGTLETNCISSDFRYNFYNWGGGPDYADLSKVWSTDSKYIVSEGRDSLEIMDPKTCKIKTVVSDQVILSSWLYGG